MYKVKDVRCDRVRNLNLLSRNNLAWGPNFTFLEKATQIWLFLPEHGFGAKLRIFLQTVDLNRASTELSLDFMASVFMYNRWA
jgi:hypothetical protein